MDRPTDFKSNFVAETPYIKGLFLSHLLPMTRDNDNKISRDLVSHKTDV